MQFIQTGTHFNLTSTTLFSQCRSMFVCELLFYFLKISMAICIVYVQWFHVQKICGLATCLQIDICFCMVHMKDIVYSKCLSDGELENRFVYEGDRDGCYFAYDFENDLYAGVGLYLRLL